MFLSLSNPQASWLWLFTNPDNKNTKWEEMRPTDNYLQAIFGIVRYVKNQSNNLKSVILLFPIMTLKLFNKN